jgi:hypothetical protein
MVALLNLVKLGINLDATRPQVRRIDDNPVPRGNRKELHGRTGQDYLTLEKL